MEKSNSGENKLTDINFIIPGTDRWEEYKELRLKALMEEPQAFALSYDSEVEAPDEKWKERLSMSHDKAKIRLVIEDQGKMVGMISSFRAEDRPDTAIVIGVYIDSNYRGKGLGKRMLGEIVSRLKEVEGISKIELTVNVDQSAAIKTYESMGFKIIGKEEDARMGDGNLYDEYVMELKLY